MLLGENCMRYLIDALMVRTSATSASFFLKRACFIFAVVFVSIAGPGGVTARQGVMPEEGKLAIEMDAFDFSMFNRGRMVGKASLTLTLVVIEQSDSEVIRLRLPQIRSDFLSALTILSRQRFKVNKPIDPDIVTAYLTPFLSNRIGAGKVNIFVKHALITPT